MKNYPETVSQLRERICANPECGILFYPKNDKAIYHCLACKNRAGYLRLQKEYEEEYKWFKDFLHNRKVLATLHGNGKSIVTDDVLNAFCFRRLVMTLPTSIDGKGIVIQYGNYALCYKDEKSYEIIKLNHNGTK